MGRPMSDDATGYRLKRRHRACANARFEVFLDEIASADGKLVQDYLVVAPKVKTGNLVTGVAVLPVMHGKIGLIRIYRHAIQARRWEVPRGFMEPGESAAESALRELEEETGLGCAAADLVSLGYLTPEPGILAARVHLFAASRCVTAKAFAAEELGHEEFRWFDSSELRGLMDSAEIEDPCTLVACLKFIPNAD